MTAWTRLERTVMTALATDLRDVVPDLARQFAASRPTVRKNSGFGLFTEMGGQSAPTDGPSGDFGSVHVTFANLRDPVAFTARLLNGRLVGLMGDSYGQDTRQIDFASAAFDQVFTIDASGRPVLVHETPKRAPEPQRPRITVPAASSVPTASPPAQVRVARPEDLRAMAQAARQGPDAVRAAAARAERYARPADPSETPEPIDDMTLMIGAWAILGVAAMLLGLFTDIPWVFLIAGAFWIGGLLRKPKARDGLRRFVEAWNSARPGTTAWQASTDR